ncbi:hypothetical protein [Rouxiella chamberiensis]|uniref:Uncharacterized protein n=1 Tax=Rouxiella chamberiensis TaxID=1513468 RepID=A0ABY7HNT1_9GAMM|nr:hypothetical protein [Rouxiella chamberiensis]WAT00687.1 hypothetical protein O1V66_17780 [Rouxiella chamberiensis]
MSQYLGDHRGAIADLHAFIILPVTLAVEYVIYFMVSYFLFDKVKTLTYKRESTFQALSLIVNALFLFIFTALYSRGFKEGILDDAVMQVDNFPASKIYFTTMAVSLVCLLGWRKIWRAA